MRAALLALLAHAAAGAPNSSPAALAALVAPASVPRHGVFEIVLTLPAASFAEQYDEDGSRPNLGLLNPYVDADLSADFTRVGGSGALLSPGGFYDSAGVFRVRFSPPQEGRWSFTIVSNVPLSRPNPLPLPATTCV